MKVSQLDSVTIFEETIQVEHPHLSIARLYRNFLETHDKEYVELEEENLKCKMSHEPIVEIRKPLVSHHDIFVTEFVYFSYPRTDTCSTV